MNKIIKVADAVGKVLMHDVTCIIPGKFKGPAFKKGHIIKAEDLEKFKNLGKENIYAFDLPDDEYHEDEAAELFKQLAGKNINISGPSEGKIVFAAAINGFMQIKKTAIHTINSITDITCSTIHSNISIKAGENIAAIRVAPLTIKKNLINKMFAKIKTPLFNIKPFVKKQVGLIVTGNEIASGRIKDSFYSIINKKIIHYNSIIKAYKVLPDEPEKITAQILTMITAGCDFIIVTGGMSVDPDDASKLAIKNASTKIIASGAPILPGNKFMVGYHKNTPIFGVPACGIFYERTALDLFLPYAFSNTKIKKNDITHRGYGGFCRHCKICTYPYCGFGKA